MTDVAWGAAASGLWQTVRQGPAFMGCIIAELVLVFIFLHILRFLGRRR